jgi:hypothetical protein
MTPEELAEEIEKLITAANTRFAGTINTVQNQLYNKLTAILKDLELDADGYIKQNAANRKILRIAQNAFDEVIGNSNYQSAVESHLKVIPKVDALNTTYFTTIEEAFTSNKNFIRDLQKQVIRDINTYILQDGLTANVKLPLNEILNTNVNTGGSFSGFNEQLRNFIKGNDKVEGRLLRYTKTYVSDTLFNYSRAWMEAVTVDLELEFYLYSGGLTGKGKKGGGSREFCIERAGNYYHRKEIEAMAGLTWQGKNPNTTKSSIFVYLGGYNCRHSVIPVSEKIVPKIVIDRAVEAGYYNKAA